MGDTEASLPDYMRQDSTRSARLRGECCVVCWEVVEYVQLICGHKICKNCKANIDELCPVCRQLMISLPEPTIVPSVLRCRYCDVFSHMEKMRFCLTCAGPAYAKFSTGNIKKEDVTLEVTNGIKRNAFCYNCAFLKHNDCGHVTMPICRFEGTYVRSNLWRKQFRIVAADVNQVSIVTNALARELFETLKLIESLDLENCNMLDDVFLLMKQWIPSLEESTKSIFQNCLEYRKGLHISADIEPYLRPIDQLARLGYVPLNPNIIDINRFTKVHSGEDDYWAYTSEECDAIMFACNSFALLTSIRLFAPFRAQCVKIRLWIYEKVDSDLTVLRETVASFQAQKALLMNIPIIEPLPILPLKSYVIRVCFEDIFGGDNRVVTFFGAGGLTKAVTLVNAKPFEVSFENVKMPLNKTDVKRGQIPILRFQLVDGVQSPNERIIIESTNDEVDVVKSDPEDD